MPYGVGACSVFCNRIDLFMVNLSSRNSEISGTHGHLQRKNEHLHLAYLTATMHMTWLVFHSAVDCMVLIMGYMMTASSE